MGIVSLISKKTIDRLKNMDVDEILSENKQNFEIPIETITRVELIPSKLAFPAKLNISANNVFKFTAIKKEFDTVKQYFQMYLADRFLMK